MEKECKVCGKKFYRIDNGYCSWDCLKRSQEKEDTRITTAYIDVEKFVSDNIKLSGPTKKDGGLLINVEFDRDKLNEELKRFEQMFNDNDFKYIYCK